MYLALESLTKHYLVAFTETSTEIQKTPTTVYWSTDLSIENSSMAQYDETSTMSWYNKGKISFTNLSQNLNCLHC